MVARKSVLIVLNTFVGGFLGAVALKVTAAVFGKDAYGEVGYALGLVGLLYVVTDLGFHGAHVKRVSEGANEADCVATFGAVKIALTGFMLLAVLGLVGARVLVQGKDFESTAILTLLVVAGYYAAKSLYSVGAMTFEATRTTVLSQGVLLAENLSRVVVTLALAALFAVSVSRPFPFDHLVPRDEALLGWVRGNGSFLVGLTWFAGALVALGVSAWLLLSHHRVGRFDRALFRSYFRFALPTFLLSVVGILSANVDRIAIGYFWSAGEVGAYFGAQRVTGLAEAIPSAVAALLFPTLSALAAHQSHARIRDVATRSLRYIMLFTVPITVFLIVFGESVFAVLLTNEWRGAGATLALLATGTLLYALLKPFFAILGGFDRPGDVARIGILMSVLNAVVTLLLVPADIKSVGIRLAGLRDVGAAIGIVVAASVGLLLARRAARRAAGPVDDDVRYGAHLVAALGAGAVFYALHAWSGVAERFYVLAIFGGVGFLAYVGVLAALREFTRDDVRFFMDLAHPGRFVREAFDRRR